MAEGRHSVIFVKWIETSRQKTDQGVWDEKGQNLCCCAELINDICKFMDMSSKFKRTEWFNQPIARLKFNNFYAIYLCLTYTYEMIKDNILFFLFFNIYFWERGQKCEQGRGGERERDRGSKAGSVLTTASLMWGFNSRNAKPWPELKSDAQLTVPNPGTPRITF